MDSDEVNYVLERFDLTDPEIQRQIVVRAFERIVQLSAGIKAVRELIDESGGVYGLHRNGDLAPWEDLRTGGKYENWLEQFDRAIEAAEAQ